MKKYTWEINEPEWDDEKDEPTGKEIAHTVSLECSTLTGKAIITIDGDSFDISAKPFSLKGTSQMFRLGSMAALIVFPKKGEPDIAIDGKLVRSGLPYQS